MSLFVFLALIQVLIWGGGKRKPDDGGRRRVERKGTFERELVRLRFFFLG